MNPIIFFNGYVLNLKKLYKHFYTDLDCYEVINTAEISNTGTMLW